MAHVEMVSATAEQLSALGRLYQLYSHDLSEFTGDCPEEDGLFAAPNLQRYLDRPDRRAYLFGGGERPAGFASVNGWSPSGRGTDWTIAEFFVVRRYRRRASVPMPRALSSRSCPEPGRSGCWTATRRRSASGGRWFPGRTATSGIARLISAFPRGPEGDGHDRVLEQFPMRPIHLRSYRRPAHRVAIALNALS